jgi:hypothetical protein
MPNFKKYLRKILMSYLISSFIFPFSFFCGNLNAESEKLNETKIKTKKNNRHLTGTLAVGSIAASIIFLRNLLNSSKPDEDKEVEEDESDNSLAGQLILRFNKIYNKIVRNEYGDIFEGVEYRCANLDFEILEIDVNDETRKEIYNLTNNPKFREALLRLQKKFNERFSELELFYHYGDGGYHIGFEIYDSKDKSVFGNSYYQFDWNIPKSAVKCENYESENRYEVNYSYHFHKTYKCISPDYFSETKKIRFIMVSHMLALLSCENSKDLKLKKDKYNKRHNKLGMKMKTRECAEKILIEGFK